MNSIERLSANLNKIENASKDIRNFIDKIVDSKSLVETDIFASGISYLDGSEALGEGVVTGYATIGDRPVYLFAQNYEVLKGSLSVQQANKIQKAMDMAIKTGVPFISIINSAGARIGEGVSVLEGYAKIIKSAAMLSGSVPHIAVIKGACVGLMSSYAALADFVFIDGKDGFVSLNAPMAVAANDMSSAKPVELFGAKAIEGSGLVTFTYDKAENLKAKISALFETIMGNESDDDANRLAPKLNTDKSLTNVLAALCDGGKYIELSAGFSSSVFTALANVNGNCVGLIATKGDDGLICENGLKKASSFVSTLDRLGLPLITLVNSTGVRSDLEIEQNGIAVTAAELLTNITLSGIYKIAVITGSAIGYAYTALASKSIGFDYVVSFADAVIAPLSADTAVNFMYKDEIAKAKDAKAAREKLTASYTEREGNPFISAKDGYVDNIIEPASLRPYICSILNMLA